MQGVFNDKARGELPVPRSANAMFEANSPIWKVHGDVTTMMIGGVAALLMQMLHPAALAGVWEHSVFRDDMLGRLRRTARFIALTTFGDAKDAVAVIDRVRHVHENVHGKLASGAPYAASDPHLLAWIHVCEATCFLNAWIAFGDPMMPPADQDRYFAQAGEVARNLGANPVPQTRDEADTLINSFRLELAMTERTHEVADLIVHPPMLSPAFKPVHALLGRASIDTLPSWVRRMHGFTASPLSAPLVQAGTHALAQSLRWAFKLNDQPTRPVAVS